MAQATGFPVEDRKDAAARNWTHVADEAHCPRCGGLMVAESFVDLLEDREHPNCAARRCVQCGEVIDPVILRNRRRQPADSGDKGTIRSHVIETSGSSEA